jgi:hypothetical protein
MDPGWVTATLALVIAVVGLAGWIGRWAWRLGRRTSQFLEDWNGRPPSPGHSGHPGVMERLVKVEDSTQQILHEVTLNSGGSLKDAVKQTQESVADMQANIASVARQVNNLPGGNP